MMCAGVESSWVLFILMRVTRSAFLEISLTACSMQKRDCLALQYFTGTPRKTFSQDPGGKNTWFLLHSQLACFTQVPGSQKQRELRKTKPMPLDCFSLSLAFGKDQLHAICSTFARPLTLPREGGISCPQVVFTRESSFSHRSSL